MKARVNDLRSIALAALRRMYRPEERLFAFRIRRSGATTVLEGVSRRYTAIVLIGLAGEPEDAAASVLRGHTRLAVCQCLLQAINQADNLGDVALTLWALRAVGHRDPSKALRRLKELDPCSGCHPTVEIAWALAALAVDGDALPDEALARQVAGRLLASFQERSGLFPHWPDGAGRSFWRSHVSCFADQVYPIHALASYYARTGDREALSAAERCAERVCRLQGPQGQWWWHYDVRSGQVVEGYPVYAVHQNAMAPMALFALQDACGADHGAAIERGIRWLLEPPEIAGSLIDTTAGLIWRKVARSGPRKLSRGIQALASRAHPSLRVPALDAVLRPRRVDYECRPYHLGWLCYAWPCGRIPRWAIG